MKIGDATVTVLKYHNMRTIQSGDNHLIGEIRSLCTESQIHKNPCTWEVWNTIRVVLASDSRFVPTDHSDPKGRRCTAFELVSPVIRPKRLAVVSSVVRKVLTAGLKNSELRAMTGMELRKVLESAILAEDYTLCACASALLAVDKEGGRE